MRNLLIEKFGYTRENVKILFDQGNDYAPPVGSQGTYPQRYRKPVSEMDIMYPDYLSCSKANVENVLTNYSWTNENDFVFIFIFTHGRYPYKTPVLEVPYGILTPLEFNENYSYDDDDYIYGDDLAQWIVEMPAQKKLVWLQPCYSGGFKQYFQEEINDHPDKPIIINYSSSDNEEAYQADSELWDADENSLVTFDENEPPNFYQNWSTPIHHGEFAYHLYSSTNGETPKEGQTSYQGYLSYIVNLSSADVNNDGIVSVMESYNFADQYQTRKYSHENQPTLEHFDYQESTSGLSIKTSLKYPNIVETFTDLKANNSSAGTDVNTGIYGVTDDVLIPSGKFVIFGPNSKIYLLNDAKIIVQSGGSLSFQSNVKVYGNSGNQIEVDGNLTVQSGTNFIREGSSGYFTGLKLNNQSGTFLFNNVVFSGTRLENHSSSLSITNSTFNNCSIIESDNGEVLIDNCTLNNTTVGLNNSNLNPAMMATITDCSIIPSSMFDIPIRLDNYDKFLIQSNNISTGYFGVDVASCGSMHGQRGFQTISENTITNCYFGILAYLSVAEISMNQIYNCGQGITLTRSSAISLYGNKYAIIYANTQVVRDCDWMEVYASEDSFPFYFKYNVIEDNDNVGFDQDPIIYYYTINPNPETQTVRYNYWGTAFDPAADFYPQNGFDYIPIWYPGIVLPDPEPNPARDLFDEAEEQFASGNFENADSLYRSVIEQYPETEFASAAMKELFRLEYFLGANYPELQDYYLGCDSILLDSLLRDLGAFLANRCDVIMENWPDAIAWYESVIQNPQSFEDSIFAIIDLENIYILMNNSGSKSVFEGNLKQYIPKNRESYLVYRDSLLMLLPGKISNKENRTLPDFMFGELMQNNPNPFSISTRILFILNSPSHVQISVRNITGDEVAMIDCGMCSEGKQFVDFKNNKLPPGLYLYSLIVNGTTTDTKKMSILR